MIFYECGICGNLHRWEWSGDCREDSERYTMDYIEDELPWDTEIREMDERVEADRQGL